MRWTNLFRGFFESERVGGILLLFCTVISLLLANSAWGDGYTHFWHSRADLSFAGLNLNFSVEQWINDGLMTIFFLLVGLEIERELYAGELSSFSNAILPVGAAVGGMLVPAAIHFFFNSGTPTQHGFGIPMATDIAFALGMLALAGNRVPYSLKIFLTALAIIDDLGAILVIALFYSSGINWLYLGLSAGILATLFLLSKLKVTHLAFYLLPGIVLWYCMMQSGIHPTIAGVLLAFAIPFSGEHAGTPSYRLQHFLHKPVAFFIVPLFALANTGIILEEGWLAEMSTANSMGIMAGLVVGKPVGILLFCALLVYLFKVKLPLNVTWTHLLGAGVLAGIGFTMSIFISNLAFSDPALVSYSKVAVLLGSLVATIVGLLIFFIATKPIIPSEK
ncbi:MAG: Na+/H+ antiporter NhaA [Chitinophagaceae bacterium]|nr:MAG: Na+/H+ antiporter NhaA [Chitinophagaceae bacterium]